MTNYTLIATKGLFSITGLSSDGLSDGDLVFESGSHVTLEQDSEGLDRTANNEHISKKSLEYLNLSDVSPITQVKVVNENSFGFGDLVDK
jgi:hypothetical protein